MKCQLSPPANLCYEGQKKNVSHFVVDRNIQYSAYKHAKDDQNVQRDERQQEIMEYQNRQHNVPSERLSCTWSI